MNIKERMKTIRQMTDDLSDEIEEMQAYYDEKVGSLLPSVPDPVPQIRVWYEGNRAANEPMDSYFPSLGLDMTVAEHFIEGFDEFCGGGSPHPLPLLTVRVPHVDSWKSTFQSRSGFMGGIQTLGWVDQFGDTDQGSTRQIIEAARKIAEWTGNNHVVLENEAALHKFNHATSGDDIATVGHHEFVDSMAALADANDITWVFNFPRPLYDRGLYPPQGRNHWTIRLTKYIADAVPNSKFMSDALGRGQQQLAHDIQSLMPPDRVVQRDFLGVETQGLYRSPQDVRAFWNQVPPAQAGNEIVTYSGTVNWLPTARAWKEMAV